MEVKAKVKEEGKRQLMREKCVSKRKFLAASPTMQFLWVEFLTMPPRKTVMVVMLFDLSKKTLIHNEDLRVLNNSQSSLNVCMHLTCSVMTMKFECLFNFEDGNGGLGDGERRQNFLLILATTSPRSGIFTSFFY